MGWLPLLSAEAQTLCPVRLTHAQRCSELPVRNKVATAGQD